MHYNLNMQFEKQTYSNFYYLCVHWQTNAYAWAITHISIMLIHTHHAHIRTRTDKYTLVLNTNSYTHIYVHFLTLKRTILQKCPHITHTHMH